MKKVLISILSVILLVGCFQGESKMQYQTITSEEAMKRFVEETDYIIIDVRTIEEYESGHIPGSINIPNETIQEEIEEKIPDKNQVIYIYCRSGNRSAQSAKKLVDLGYQNIYDFGGINTWTGEIVVGE